MRTYFTKRTGFRKVRNKKGNKFKWQEAQGTVGQSAVNYVRRRRSIFTRCDGYHWFEANSYRCDLFRPLISTSFLDSQVTSCIATVDTRDLSVVQVREQIANYITREERLFNQFFFYFLLANSNPNPNKFLKKFCAFLYHINFVGFEFQQWLHNFFETNSNISPDLQNRRHTRLNLGGDLYRT